MRHRVTELSLSCLALSCLALCSAAAQSRGIGAGKQLAEPRVSEARVALVIGNGAYRDAPLRNPVNDADAVAAVLRRAGFRVTERVNLSRREMIETIREFGHGLQQGGVGLFYYAGHGIQVRDRNYLIPVDARIEKEGDVELEGVDVARVLGEMEEARSRLNLVILDACRNNPYTRSFRSATRGLTQMSAPAGTLIAFSTAPGEVAADGDGRNGIYTEALVRVMRTPGVEIGRIFREVRSEVRRRTNSRQVPWETSSIEGEFFLFPAADRMTAASPEAPAPTSGPAAGSGEASGGLFDEPEAGGGSRTRAAPRPPALSPLLWFGFAAGGALLLAMGVRARAVVRRRSAQPPHAPDPAATAAPPLGVRSAPAPPPSDETTAIEDTGWVLARDGAAGPELYPVPAGRPLAIGRRDDADVRLDSNDRKASRNHCQLRVEDGRLLLEDVESRNGTFVNGESVTRRHLQPGDRVSCGASMFRVLRTPGGAREAAEA